jgi:hypothetical protein
MIISYICGGLGNQMFQYAAGRRLAIHRQTELKLDLSSYVGGFEQRPAEMAAFQRPIKLHELNIAAPTADKREIRSVSDRFNNRSMTARAVRLARRSFGKDLFRPKSHIIEKQYRFDPHILDLPDSVYLSGFWQSWKYFADIDSVIRKEFQIKDLAIPDYAGNYVAQLRSKAGGEEIVSLHVRRGDVVHATETLGKLQFVHGYSVALEYILKAASRFNPTTHFLVFSDTAKDIQWCRDNIKADGLDPGRLHFSDGHTDLQDMAIMSACDHHIIANSTFSWWSAWLDPKPGKRVVAPRIWSPPNSKNEMVVDDLIPPGWEMI